MQPAATTIEFNSAREPTRRLRAPWLLAALLAVTTVQRSDAAPPAVPLLAAHAHNDYRHARPLLDALDRGFCNVEADVFLADAELLVGHDKSELRPDRTLEALYLAPLKARADANGGEIFRNGPRLTLLVDFKSDGPAAYAALAKLLNNYKEIVSGVEGGVWTPRAVDVVISGNRPIETVEQDATRRAAIDGRVPDLQGTTPAELIPMISDNWRNHFTWTGRGPMPPRQQAKLRRLAADAKSQQRRLRFWATPDDPRVWRELRAAGVDLIGTDDLDALRRFLREEMEE